MMSDIIDLDALMQDFTGEPDLDKLVNNQEYGKAISKLVSTLEETIKETGIHLDKLLKQLSDYRSGESFWGHIRMSLSNKLEPYYDTGFLREMESDDRIHFLQEVFEGMIHYQEPMSYLQGKLGVDRKQLEITYKVYNTLSDWVIINRNSKRYFLIKCRDMFAFDDALSENLWKIVENNRKMLTERIILKNFDAIESFFEEFNNYLNSLEEESDEDKS